MNKFIVLYGPTAVGKTDIGLQIADAMNAEIINMDVGQFYTPFSIGTAKPDWKNNAIPHHLFDCIDEPINFSVMMYKKMVLATMNLIWSRGKTPLLIGGSGFYLYSLLFQFENICSKSENFFNNEKKDPALWEQLRFFDEKRAEKIHPNDYYRILRALEIYQKTNIFPSVSLPRFKPIAACDIVFLSRDRDDLYNRINQRTAMMLSSGFISEVEAIVGTPWEEFILRKKLIGYNELVSSIREAKAAGAPVLTHSIQGRIAQRTRQYAKRQYTFWRHLEKKLTMNKEENGFDCRMHTVHLTSNRDENAMQEILNYIKNY